MRPLSLAIALVVTAPGIAAEHEEFFERRVRPILAEKCISCHGEKKQESGLRLDSRDAVLRGGDNGRVVDKGNARASRLLAAVRYTDEDLRMPPAGKLSDREIATLARWVELDLPWPNALQLGSPIDEAARHHWAFQPIERPELPIVRDAASWVRTPIDRFVLARLEQAGLTPSSPANRQQLLRRISFDLTGLPPTPVEVTAFQQTAEPSPMLIDQAIDRLLASPAYGERWARHWLDVARYADNKGYVFFEDKQYPWAYTYRDYVVRSLNEDKPYDQFVLEQLAADQLDLGDDKAPLTAMGFVTLGGHFMNNTHDIIDDRIDVLSRGLLGLTVSCARCHDHKYDPIPQADYYSLYGVFASGFEPIVLPEFQSPPQSDEYAKFTAEMKKREQALVDFVTTKHRELVTDARTRIAEYLLAAHERHGKPPADNFMLLVDKGDLNPTMLLRWQIYLEDAGKHPRVWSTWRELAEASAEDFTEQVSRVVARLVAEDAVNPRLAEQLQAEPVASIEQLAERYASLLKQIDQQWRERLSAAGSDAPSKLDDPGDEELRTTLYGEHAPADAPLKMNWGFISLFPDRPTQGEFKKLIKEVEDWAKTGAGAPPRAMVLYDSPQPHQPRIFLRGNPNRLGDAVPRQFLTALQSEPKPFSRGSGRLELAQEIVDGTNPLTARVIVNRIWLHHFGTGLVSTPSDFGLRSDPPTHPKLLDWLASELIDSGWSIKHLHRLILRSAVYQQQSNDRDDCRAVDPENRLLWKANRRRLEFEALRDAVLAVADQLDRTMHGQAVAMFGGQVAKRRTIYGYIDRMDVAPLLTTFDFPNPAASSPGRTTTTVPPQALYLMNNRFAATAATELLQRPLIRDQADVAARLASVYAILFARAPSAADQEAANGFLGPTPDSTRWQQLVHALLMTNEFTFVD